MKACLLGSTGVVVETSRLQRLAYNAAFEELGLDLYWNVAAYCSLLRIPGEIRRLELALGDEAPMGLADEAFTMQRKHFTRIAEGGLQLRPGIADVIGFCKRNDIRLGWVTTEDSALVDLLLERTVGIDESTFDMVLSEDDVGADKPDPAIYHHALSILEENPVNVIAVEDTPLGQSAALKAELQCYLYAGEYAMVENNVLATRDIYQAITRAHSLWGHGDDLPGAMPIPTNANLL
ncbi:CbbY family protein [Luminiphilus syltensis NOR5-1B]|uniref:CbbY family protein n=1 Tax=Luminiphilus syltensis NOR5-1B TaxID=565045 RepID=B8KTE6_9GAMM|nr:HAD-IA family hydrolase [Luminiphilus syltensis]EED35751.1 CbbY family protein [Luminiphilus syltensis NOR5-1B]